MPKLLTAVAVAVLTLSAVPAAAEVLVTDHVRGYCLDANMTTRQFIIWNCHGGSNQNFAFSGYGPVRVGNQCMDTQSGGRQGQSRAGEALVLTGCSNARSQRWGYDSAARALRNEEGYCADIAGEGRQRGTPVIVWQCHGRSNQKWVLGRVAGIAQAAGLGVTSQQLQQLQGADRMINGNGGNIVGSGGGNIVASGGGNIIAAGGGNLVVTQQPN